MNWLDYCKLCLAMRVSRRVCGRDAGPLQRLAGLRRFAADLLVGLRTHLL